MLGVSWLFAGMPALAETESEKSETGEYLANFYRIPAAALGEVFTLDTRKLTRNALVLGAVGLAYAYDEDIREHWMEHYSSKSVDKVTGTLANVGSTRGELAYHAAAAAAALAFRNDYLMETTLLSGQALIVAQMFTEAAKAAAGRERPRDSEGDSRRWRSGGGSFFSGHASSFTASMTVFAERYEDNPLIYWGAYTMAGAMALSRINEDAHWTSDALLGSLVGHGIGRLTLRYNPFGEDSQAILLPLIDGNQYGLALMTPF